MVSIARRALETMGWPGPAAALPVSADAASRLAPLAATWGRQVEAARQHGVASVESLTAVFANIERQLAQAIAMTEVAAKGMQSGSEGGMAGAIDVARERLQHMLGMIESAVASNHALFDQVTQAVQAVRELNETAQSVERISQMTTLLSINARIEAARAGDAGKGFAVVADEVRRLAAQSRQESQAIITRVARIEAVILRTAESADALKQRDLTLIERSRSDMGDIVDELGGSMRHVMDTSDALCQLGQITRKSVTEALVNFQFQDRVSQQLEHVRLNTAEFSECLQAGWPDSAQVDALEARLRASYTMPEEGRIHRQEPEPTQDSVDLVMF